MSLIYKGQTIADTGGGTEFTTDESLTLTEDGVLGVTTPVKSVLRQSEYDALPPEEKSRGLYFIDEPYGEDASRCEEVYSTEEIRVGTWHNGKPLYRKCFPGLTSPSTNGQVDDFLNVENLSIDELPICGGTIGRFPIPIANGTVSAYIWLATSKTTLAIYVNGSSVTAKPVTVILEYTKTTDPEVTT